MTKYDIFISYSSHNQKDAKQICVAMQTATLACFMAEKDLSGGDDFASVVRSALLNSRELCLLMTPESLNSEWVITEWGAAWVLEKRITPVLLRCSIKQLPQRLHPLHFVDFHDIKRYVEECRSRKDSHQRQARESYDRSDEALLAIRGEIRAFFDYENLIVSGEANHGTALIDDSAWKRFRGEMDSLDKNCLDALRMGYARVHEYNSLAAKYGSHDTLTQRYRMLFEGIASSFGTVVALVWWEPSVDDWAADIVSRR